jgi:Ca2+-binding RTX toxin-like protein
MSLLSRNAGGGRRGVAKVAAVFAGTLVTYLVVTAIPAMAASTCTVATTAVADDTLNVVVDTDDTVALGIDGANNFQFSINGDPFVACGATTATVTWVHITGSNAGNETLILFRPDDWTNSGPTFNTAVTVDLGNGNDNLVWEYGALASPATADDNQNNVACIGSAPGTLLVADQNCGGVGDIRVDNAETFVINGGGGDDFIDAGNLGGFSANTGVTGTTNDNVPGSNTPASVNFTLNGGNGDDFLVSGDGNDNLQGGPGDDGVSYEAASNGVVVNLTAATGTGMGNDTLANVQDAFGSAFDDSITGNSLDNDLFGDDGDDTIDGAAGNDTVNGQDGDDTVKGADGDDTVDGEAGNDHLLGGNGLDSVSGGDGNDIIDEGNASNGEDSLAGDAGFDTLDYSARTTDTRAAASSGNSGQISPAESDNVDSSFEVYMTGTGNDELTGDGTDETFVPDGGSYDVDGNGGFDTLDFITGPVTVDLEVGIEEIELLDLTDGDDTVLWAGVAPLIDIVGGAGEDTIDASAAAVPVTINLTAFVDVENAFGGSAGDTLTGNALNNTLLGGAGADTINAGTGNDFVEGGADNDTLQDGGGADTLSYRHASAGVTVDLANGFASGGDGEDTLTGVFETVLGSDFNDTITAGQTAFDVPVTLKGFGGKDTLIGSNSTDTLVGGGGKDELRMGAGDDTGKGGAANDLILAGNGDDVLKGGKGKDEGVGGKGFDVCKGIEKKRSCEG